MEFPPLIQISECFIKPKYETEEAKNPYYLSPMDLMFLSCHYNQKGLLFTKLKNDDPFFIDNLLESLKNSLALTLVHFYPLAGQFESIIDEDQHRMLVFVDCNKGSGVRFVHVKLDVTISDIVTPNVPSVARSFFDFSDGELNFDGHTRPLLSIQVTDLIDGIFIGCSMNHAIVDGTSYWHFWNVWSEIHRANGQNISILRLPIHDRWFPDGYGSKDTFFPFVNRNEFIHGFNPPPFEERFFHFSSETIAKLKARANQEISSNNTAISSFQALAAFLWKSIIQAKGLKPDQQTHCKLAANNRTRLNPPLPEEYFGNSLIILTSTTTVGELFKHNLGWTASLVQQSVVDLTNKTVNDFADSWFKSPFVIRLDQMVEKDEGNSVQVGSSPRFNIYGNEFAGLGKPIAVRSGYANKYDGKITVYPGFEGRGSVDAEISLSSAYMRALESNKEFMAVVSSP